MPYKLADGTAARKTTEIDLIIYVNAYTGEVMDSESEVYTVYD